MHRTKILVQWMLGFLWVSSVYGLSVPTTETRSTSQLFSKHFPAAKEKIPQHELILTYLEINGFLMTTAGVTIMIDPVLEGPLDFGIPDLYRGTKKNLPSFNLCESLPSNIDCILITQGLDDHAHVRTLTKLAGDSKFDGVPIVAPPSARCALQASGMLRPSNVRFLRHGERTTISSRDSSDAGMIEIRATSGALVGPPWQTRENGYILRPSASSFSKSILLPPSIYIEPHVEFDKNMLRREAPIDVVITPIIGQRLPILDLVYGPENTIQLVEILTPKVIVPMSNANIDQVGIAASLVSQNGSDLDFFQFLEKSLAAGTKVQGLVPGRDETIEF